jgi:hypothetical protein
MTTETAIAIQQGHQPGIRLSRHAAAQAVRKGFPLLDVILAANDPATIYDNGRYPGQTRHIRGRICAVIDHDSAEVVTIYENVATTALRDDQRTGHHATDALTYEQRLTAGAA